MNDKETIFKKIDIIREKVNEFKINPLFEIEVDERNSRQVPKLLTDNQLLKTFVTLVAYSQGANSKFVRNKLIKSEHFDRIFLDFSIEKVSKIKSSDFFEENWSKPLTYIQKKGKILKIIDFAQKMKSGSLTTLLTETNIPKKNSTEDDIEEFWKGFKILQAKLKERDIPFLQSTTTLLHYLLETGYDCIKPDLVVMKVARKIGILDRETGDANFRKTVKLVQQYSMTRNIRPSIVDLYFLIDEKQKGAMEYVHSNYHN